MKPIYLFSLIITTLLPGWLSAQALQPGFDKEEYIELLKISIRTVADSAYADTLPAPENFSMAYQSPVIGLENLWQLWLDGDQAVISIRGTTKNSTSWLANFYAAMVPATGKIQLNTQDTFHYQLSTNPQSAVHVGWLISTGFLSADILPKLDSLYQQGTRNVLIMGHSQGGAIAYLLTAHLLNLQHQQKLPADIRFKTYCSAAPKPGNLYFAYEYEAMTQGGWAYNVVNAADWVPETPISIQTFNDFNPTNPFANAKVALKSQKFPKDIILGYVYDQLNRPTLKAKDRYQKYLGKSVSKQVGKKINGFTAPEYFDSNHYVRTGTTIVLKGDEAYTALYPDHTDNPTAIFTHHIHAPYLYLAARVDTQ